LETRIRRANAAMENTRVSLGELTYPERHKLAAQQRANADETVQAGGRIEADARRRYGWLGPVREILPIIDASQKALEEKLKDDVPLEDYNRLYTHYQRMKRIYDSEAPAG
jgi:hypothetical protein